MRLTSVATLVCVLLSGAAAAETIDFSDGPDPAAPPAAAFAAPAPGTPEAPPASAAEARYAKRLAGVDPRFEAALRYYAARRDRPRVEAEIRRLKALDPQWSVPEDLYPEPPAGPREQELWDLFAADRLDEIDARIAARRAAEPGYAPSPDLMRKLALKRARAALLAAGREGKWEAVTAAAAAHPALLACADAEPAFRLAEALTRTGAAEEAESLFAAMLRACPTPEQRLAAAEAAARQLDPAAARRVLLSAGRDAQGRPIHAGLLLDLTRRAMARVLSGAEDAAPPPEAIADLQSAVAATRAPEDLALVGFYLLHRGAAASADAMFRLGDLDHDAKLAEGHVLALRAAGSAAEAERLTAAWRRRSPPLRDLYIGDVVTRLGREPAALADPARRLDDMALFAEARSAAGARALGWFYYRGAAFADAAFWFRVAQAWTPPSPEGRPARAEAIEGEARALQRQGQWREAARRVFDARAEGFPLDALALDLAVADLTAPAPAPALDAALRARYVDLVTDKRSVPGAEALAWEGVTRGDWASAADWFLHVRDWTPAGTPLSDKTVEGAVLALGEARRFSAGLDFVAALPPRMPARDALAHTLLRTELARAEPGTILPGDHLDRLARAAEASRDAAFARDLGWYFHDRAAPADTVRWFRAALDWAGTGPGSEKSAEGLILALAEADQPEALALADSWHARSPELASLAVLVATGTVARRHPPDALAAEDLDRAGRIIADARSAAGAGTLGWYALEHLDLEAAARRFKDGLDWSVGPEPDPKLAEGYVLALRGLGRFAEAEALAAQGLAAPASRAAYIDLVAERLTRPGERTPVAPDVLARYAGAVQAARSADGAQALGWYALAARQPAAAIAWFETALGWEAKETTARGLVLAARAAHDEGRAAAAIARYGQTFPSLARLRASRSAGAGSRPARASVHTAFRARDYGACIARAAALEAEGRAGPGDRLAKGWCLMAQQRVAEAAASFAAARGGETPPAEAGLAAAASTARAAGVSPPSGARTAAQLSDRRRRELAAATLGSQAQAAFDAGSYDEAIAALDRRNGLAPEPRGYGLLRGWALYHLGRLDEARQLFAQLDRTESTADTRKGLGAVDYALTPPKFR